ncbi:hypothetical protein Clacol_001236 [Clathrus columnatus]|uniref:Uncharacterized protein n=1 Tax=Clathrus columnatus TaxID=1419009 RepID=A0AAV5A0P6_9AGAM|nr:hypothetical protein Clacol_001236 [Clathrus columnatus]
MSQLHLIRQTLLHRSQVWDERFLDILGPDPRMQIIAQGSDEFEFEFAHEKNNDVFVIKLKDAKDIPGPQNIT